VLCNASAEIAGNINNLHYINSHHSHNKTTGDARHVAPAADDGASLTVSRVPPQDDRWTLSARWMLLASI